MEEKKYTLYTLGSRGTFPVFGNQFMEFGGQTTCYCLKVGHHALIIDCGTGLYDAESILKDCDQIDVVLTHVHYDHILGLLNPFVFPSDIKINFYASFDFWFGEETINEFIKEPFWPIKLKNGNFHTVGHDDYEIKLSDGIKVMFEKSNHPNGADVLFVKFKDHKIGCLFDYEHDEKTFLNRQFCECDILIYDGMFNNEEYSIRKGWGHSTYENGCMLARKNKCNQLFITHHSPYCDDEELLRREFEAKKMFENTHFLRSGDKFEL